MLVRRRSIGVDCCWEEAWKGWIGGEGGDCEEEGGRGDGERRWGGGGEAVGKRRGGGFSAEKN